MELINKNANCYNCIHMHDYEPMLNDSHCIKCLSAKQFTVPGWEPRAGVHCTYSNRQVNGETVVIRTAIDSNVAVVPKTVTGTHRTSIAAIAGKARAIANDMQHLINHMEEQEIAQQFSDYVDDIKTVADEIDVLHTKLQIFLGE